MKIKKFVFNPFQLNSYIYIDEASKEVILIDPGVYLAEEENILSEFCKKNGLNVKYIINTHGHIDHILGNRFCREHFDVPLYIHKEDLFLVENAFEQGQYFGIDVADLPDYDSYINEGDIFTVGDEQLKVIHTPGHSPGSICLADYKNKIIFCGDLIFKNSVGRTDLPKASFKALMNSVTVKLFEQFSGDFILYPGHMESTTITDEKKYNPFLR
ncbi:MAG: MBL fold metallo-hydrolase [Ignavibacteria bacterium]|nr:MBL fold metallo-hydrolase [Ignavibacteria bacterium]